MVGGSRGAAPIRAVPNDVEVGAVGQLDDKVVLRRLSENDAQHIVVSSFKKTLDEKQIWQIAFFLKHGTKDLPPAAAAIWNKPHGD